MRPPSRLARLLRRSASEHVPVSQRSWLSERGQALLETAVTLPLLLLVSVGIFEFGRAYQCWQILTNAAREGARVAVLPTSTYADAQARVTQYMQDGQIGVPKGTLISIAPTTVQLSGTTTAPGSKVTIDYPFSFIMLNPVAKLVAPNTKVGASAFTMSVSVTMRNES